MDVVGIVVITGLACLAVAGIVALTRPIDNWRQVALRLAVLGVVLTVVSAIVSAVTNSWG